ncbi:MAG: hypothetical protein MJ171_05215 [Clostridia bacterium]|nr:hypothetical protein [Clostridia bacterium]
MNEKKDRIVAIIKNLALVLPVAVIGIVGVMVMVPFFIGGDLPVASNLFKLVVIACYVFGIVAVLLSIFDVVRGKRAFSNFINMLIATVYLCVAILGTEMLRNGFFTV